MRYCGNQTELLTEYTSGEQHVQALAHEVCKFEVLASWWNAELTPPEQEHLARICHHRNQRGVDELLVATHSAQMLLESIAHLLRASEDHALAQRILDKVPGLTDQREPGLHRGRHLTTYVNEVTFLMRSARTEEAEELLLALLRASEEQSIAKGFGVGSWYYERLAVIYRRRMDFTSEIAVLERYCRAQSPFGPIPDDIHARLEKARVLDSKSRRQEASKA